MRLITFERLGEIGIGAITAQGIVDFREAAPALPRTMIALLAAGARAMQTAHAVAARAQEDRVGLVPSHDVTLRAPLPRPGKIFGIGLNYRDHAEETGSPIPTVPQVFSKAVTAVIGPGEAIVIPPASSAIDYEGELAVVIGRVARGVAAADALAYVAGYTVMNDVTARDYQMRSGHCIGKSFDTFAPMGPAIVTADEVGDAGALALRTVVSGVELQRSNTRHLIFDVASLIEYISAGVTLEPGDIISTGTPAGVGVRRDPRRFLQPGDTVRIEIDAVGVLENPVAGGQPPALLP